MKIGDINVPESIIDQECRIIIIERFIDLLVKKNPDLNFPSLDEFNEIRETTIKILQKKYPSMGIEKKEKV